MAQDLSETFVQRLEWTRLHMPLVRRGISGLPDLSGVRLACSIHLDIKLAPVIEGLLERGAEVFLTTCNPQTVRDDVVAYLVSRGARAAAHHGMSAEQCRGAVDEALAWRPTHLCEMGAELSRRIAELGQDAEVRASLEATGSGITALADVTPRYPIFNWDDLPVKEGLHNRHMVGLTAWHAFMQRTRLSLHGKRVLVVGFGLVGQGTADAARAFGGAVSIAELCPVRTKQAEFAGWPVVSLAQGLKEADVIVTATGVEGVIASEQFKAIRDGAFLLNVGHRDNEIDVPCLLAHPNQEALPFVQAVQIDAKRTVFLFANGSMANLTAGDGDSVNAFDVTLAVMTAGIAHIIGSGAREKPGLYLLPAAVWQPFLR